MTVMVLFGGVTTEHEISVVTAVQAMNQMRRHRIYPVYIGRDGVWRYGAHLKTVEAIKACKHTRPVWLTPGSPFLKSKTGRICKVDCILSCMHGLCGEDGSVAVWAETSGIAYTCCGIGASAIGMDKIATKHLVRGLDLPTVSCVTNGDLTAAEALGFPLVVKPCRLGSSIGISMVHDAKQLTDAVKTALSFDQRVLIEKGIVHRREFNVAVIGDRHGRQLSEVEEVGGLDEVLSFTDKYLRDGKVKGMDNVARQVPAKIDEALRDQIRETSLKLCESLDTKGIVRIDYIYDLDNKQLFVNEINIVPGSLAYYLFPKLGMSGVVERILNDAVRSKKEEDCLQKDYRRAVAHPK